IRRELIETLPIPVGYGVEFATLTDTWQRYGLSAIAQVDLGRRGHRHQAVHDLGVMAAEILATAMRRLPGGVRPAEPAGTLMQYDRDSADGRQQSVLPGAAMLRLGRHSFADDALLIMAIVNRTPDSFYDRGATYAFD